MGSDSEEKDLNLKTTGGLLYYQYDGRRNVSEVTDRHGDLIERYRYDAFGGVFTGTTSPYNHHGYTGMRYDGKTGLVDLSARWYNPTAGKFMNEDTYPGVLSQPQTQNRYSYALNNPVNLWDPSGHVAEPIDFGKDIPDWVRNKANHSIDEITGGLFNAYHDWNYQGYSEVKSLSRLIDTVMEERQYMLNMEQDVTNKWFYEYVFRKAKVDGVDEFPIGEPTITPIEFKEEKTVTWDEYISAELIATLNAEKISRYGAPADARVINRLVTLPASFDRYVELKVRSHLWQVQPENPNQIIVNVNKTFNEVIKTPQKRIRWVINFFEEMDGT